MQLSWYRKRWVSLSMMAHPYNRHLGRRDRRIRNPRRSVPWPMGEPVASRTLDVAT